MRERGREHASDNMHFVSEKFCYTHLALVEGSKLCVVYFLSFCCCWSCYLVRERERERVGGGGGERERERMIMNHFYYEDDGFRPWPSLPTSPLSMHI